MSVSAYVINNKYKRLSKKEKQSLEKSLKKMGFFVLVALLLSISASGEDAYFSDDRGLYPVVVPADALSPAEDTVEELTYDAYVLLDETTWRLGIKNFLNITTNNTNSTNPMEVMIS